MKNLPANNAIERRARRVKHVADTHIVAYYLHVRCRKTASLANQAEEAIRSGAVVVPGAQR